MATTSGAFTPVSGRTLSFDTRNVPDEQTREDAVLMDSVNSYPSLAPPQDVRRRISGPLGCLYAVVETARAVGIDNTSSHSGLL
jgi:hypothetical protein